MLLLIECYFLEVLHYLFLKQVVQNQVMQGTDLNFKTFWINLSVAVMAMWSQFLFIFKTVLSSSCHWLLYLNLTPDGINTLTTIILLVCNYRGAGLFLFGLNCSFKVFIFYWETIFTRKFISFYHMKQSSSIIMPQSYLPWNYFWHNYFQFWMFSHVTNAFAINLTTNMFC